MTEPVIGQTWETSVVLPSVDDHISVVAVSAGGPLPGTGSGVTANASSTLRISNSTIRKISNTDVSNIAYGMWFTGNSTTTVTNVMVHDVEDDVNCTGISDPDLRQYHQIGRIGSI